MAFRIALALGALATLTVPAVAQEGRAALEAAIQRHAAENNVPPSLVHRIIVRESRYNPRAVGRGGAMGLMQIKAATARGMGYSGSPSGLLDAETNLRYAVKYLAGAYKTAGGNQDRAVRYYASGYYYAAKSQGLTGPRAERRRYRHARHDEGQPLSLWPFSQQ
ncbi:endo-type membrane-bound lytic murein transglycosylase A precursor [Variibacter gotjawalensis]|uniref:Endo-type membrane-bound lytic murein transglycosylase A n=1 Tax=Variibacter gotjawalensis TaxID=1333996 RepID=A0A0S3PR72_9BRAD|nr:transglycosylase SLT domain-containing protein [Variibacter gotjawalensis]NIK48709.1 soluble lytic murein transglycosylase-like protein [Variibacter gotjawalensis]RZS50570.1 transglycosylase-like protein with SLT domain [Variibacter gotjawalensis]BAT58404.1 endo-type membrane-bound lytic murein transglycosylase A precursor [Variibacter gotjawalensis]